MVRYILFTGIGGFVGAILRYILSGIIPVKFGLPTGTLLVNLIGSFFLGFLMYSSLFLPLPPEYKFLFGTGFCGALTTFSTFAYETFVLIDEGLIIKAMINVSINVIGCLLLVYIGRNMALLIFRNL